MSAAGSSSKKYSSVSASSFLDLKAELNKHEDDFAKTKHLGSTTSGAKRPASGKPSPWAKRNKGIGERDARDRVQYEADPTSMKHDPARLMAQLEKKALLYDKIKKGKTGGLDETQIDSLLVDFDRKQWENGSDDSENSGSEDDESTTVPVRPLESDPLVEWTDEFGRTRFIPRSEVPRGSAVDDAPAADETNVHYGDQHHFPVYAPDPAVLAARAAAYAKSEPLVSHYDATKEKRSKAAGFYAFSTDEATRADQMASLKAEREATEVNREKAVSGGGAAGERERQKEERKRKLEDKRRELEEKRRAKAG